MGAKEILDEIRAEEVRRIEEGEPFDPTPEQEALWRRWRIQKYSEAIEADDSCVEAYVRRGTELYYEGRYQDSRADMKRAFSLKPTDPYFYELIALPFDEAEARQIQAVGSSLEVLERQREIREYSEQIASARVDAAAYVARGTALDFEGRYEESRADMLKAFDLAPTDPELYGAMCYPFEAEDKRKILKAGIALADPGSECHTRLTTDLIHTFWYQGEFSTFVSMFRDLIQHVDPNSYSYGHSLQAVAQGYSALGLHEEAEASYRRALEAASNRKAGDLASMIVRTRLHRGQHEYAKAALTEFESVIPGDERTVWEAVLTCLSDPRSAGAQEQSLAALGIAEATVARPAGVPRYLTYDCFLLGVLRLSAGRVQEGKDMLEPWVAQSEANPTEWGVTMRWEIAKAKELLAEF